jgi:hypothetical protein
VLEPDGSPAREFFTVLNVTGQLSLEQHLNIHAFSALRAYLTAAYAPKEPGAYAVARRLYLCLSSPTSVSLCRSSPLPRPSPEFIDDIVAYCLRVMDQAKVKGVDSAARSTSQQPDVSAVAFAEALRILDVVCALDQASATKLLPVIKRSAALPASQGDGSVFLAHLQFFLDHSVPSIQDVEPFFQNYFDTFVSANCEPAAFCRRRR